MKIRVVAVVALLGLSGISSAFAAPAPAKLDAPVAPELAPELLAVGQIRTTWRDEARRRDVPVNVFYPRSTGPFPLVIVSHGLGGSRDGLDYLGRYWAQHGYVCAQIQHIGTDDSLWRGAATEAAARTAMSKAASDPANIFNRPRDVSFAIDQMLALNGDAKSAFFNRIDATKIGVAGHSLGGFTALLSAGQKLAGGGFAFDLHDARIKACVAMSAPLNPATPLKEQFAAFAVPAFYIVGALDKEVLGATIAQREIYDAIAAPDQYLLIVSGADHMTFAGQRFGPDFPGDAHDHALAQIATQKFWDATLKAKAGAKVWLRDDLEGQIGEGSVLEEK